MTTISLFEAGKEFGFLEIEGSYLELIGVWPEFRGQGKSVQLIELLFDWMRQHNEQSIGFLDNNPGFWRAMKKKFPKNIFIYPSGEGEIFI